VSTLVDVAKKAGVSVMTVSRVVNNKGTVNENTRKKVYKALEELSYKPNLMAKGLVTRRSNTIAYIMSNISNPFFANVSNGIGAICAERGYFRIILDATSEKGLNDCISIMIEHQTEGAIFHHLNLNEETVSALNRDGIKVVTIDNERILDGVPEISSDDFDGGYRAANYLIDRGHNKIACIHGKISDTTDVNEGEDYIETFQRKIWRNRTEGFLKALREHGLEPEIMIEGRGTVKNRSSISKEDFKRLKNNPEVTAVYCENDVIARSLLGECIRYGIRVPEDLAIIGHDGMDPLISYYPRIASVVQPQHEIGRLAAEMLIDYIESDVIPNNVVTHSEIREGDSV